MQRFSLPFIIAQASDLWSLGLVSLTPIALDPISFELISLGLVLHGLIPVDLVAVLSTSSCSVPASFSVSPP